jgi:hypothetical protein
MADPDAIDQTMVSYTVVDVSAGRYVVPAVARFVTTEAGTGAAAVFVAVVGLGVGVGVDDAVVFTVGVFAADAGATTAASDRPAVRVTAASAASNFFMGFGFSSGEGSSGTRQRATWDTAGDGIRSTGSITPGTRG